MPGSALWQSDTKSGRANCVFAVLKKYKISQQSQIKIITTTLSSTRTHKLIRLPKRDFLVISYTWQKRTDL